MYRSHSFFTSLLQLPNRVKQNILNNAISTNFPIEFELSFCNWLLPKTVFRNSKSQKDSLRIPILLKKICTCKLIEIFHYFSKKKKKK